MVLVKRVRSRGVNMVIEANAEVVFAPGGIMPGFTRSLSNKVRGFAIQAAPSNKRPRWSHYGLPLKRTIKSSTRADARAMKVYMAVGATAPHAAYVDQGTGIYAGRGPYQAKILPPWTPGDPSLFEHTWRPGPGQPPVGTTTVRGQKGQFFFDKAVQQGFASMGIASVKVPGQKIDAVPDSLLGFMGNTVADAAFIGQLEEWRAWRDDAFRRGGILAKGRGTRGEDRIHNQRFATSSALYHKRLRNRPSPEKRKKQNAERAKRYRARARKAKSTQKPKVDARKASIAAERARFLAAALKKYPGQVLLDTLQFRGNHWYVTVLAPNSNGIATPREIRGREV